MSIGGMTRLLTLQQPVLSPDGGGGFAAAWEDTGEVYARIEELGGGETLRQGQVAAESTFRITLHHRADITAAMRLAADAGIYEIISFRDPDGRGATLEIIARRAT